jgi:hypothetical protein
MAPSSIGGGLGAEGERQMIDTNALRGRMRGLARCTHGEFMSL